MRRAIAPAALRRKISFMRLLPVVVSLVSLFVLGGAALLAQDNNPANKTRSPLDSTAAPPSSGAGSFANDMGPANNPPVPVNAAAPQPFLSGHLSRADRAFLRAANQGGIFEIQTGEFAGMNGTTYAVRKMGRQVARDHRRIGASFGALARIDGLELPDGATRATQDRIGALTALSGPPFDRAYARTLREAHRKDIAAFENEAAATRNAGLRDAIDQALPTLRRHLAMADDCCTATQK